MIFDHLPLRYVEPVYRPPSEARSLIFQVTIGCSNLVTRPDGASPTGYRVRRGCAFCVAYQRKRFRIRKQDEVLSEIDTVAPLVPQTRRVFLADGDALVVKTERLLDILQRLYGRFPALERVTAYGGPRNLLKKSPADLRRLRDAGLSMIYLGIESGDDEVLRRIDKRSNSGQIVEACIRARQAGLALSVTVILGLGGPRLSQQHAAGSARAVSQINPEYAAALTLMVEPRVPTFQEVFDDPAFRLLDVPEALAECRHFLSHVDSEGTEFRSNHASNWLALKGKLNRDQPRLVRTIDEALGDPSSPLLRPDYWRAL